VVSFASASGFRGTLMVRLFAPVGSSIIDIGRVVYSVNVVGRLVYITSISVIGCPV
jgi:hypothetical protein